MGVGSGPRMDDPWNLFGFLCSVLIFLSHFEECSSLNAEGAALMKFKSKVEYDPYVVLENWNPEDDNPCRWTGVRCVGENVDVLDLNGMSLAGMLVPELGNLSHMRTLSLCQNNLSGVIPKEMGRLTMLVILDLSNNNLSGTVPTEISELPLLRTLLLCHNKFQGSILSDSDKLNNYAIQCEGDCHSHFHSHNHSAKHRVGKHGNNLEIITEPYIFHEEDEVMNFIHRRLLKTASNLPAIFLSNHTVYDNVEIPSIGSGSFPAIPSSYHKRQPFPAPEGFFPDPPPPPLSTTESITSRDTPSLLEKILAKWQYILVAMAIFVLLILAATLFFISRSRSAATMGHWNTGLSGQLRKAFVAGVPKLNRAELEAACEDFSNIIQRYPVCTVYKGTLSSGVEIAVASTVVSSSRDWSKRSDMHFRQKLDTLSRINHKNFVNLLGYCLENDPFTRMMVFEFTSSGTLFEHLHAKGLEHLDWSTRMRIIMGVGYCLHYMHHEIRPPIAHTNLRSNAIFLTDDYAAKLAEIDFWEVVAKGRIAGDELADSSAGPTNDPRSNIYSFGILLLEIISGRPTYAEYGSIVNWAEECLSGNQSITYLVDPTLNSIKNEELDVIYEVIQECTNQDPRKRPTMKNVISKLREVIAISPDAAAPRLSPLWWAELEILSVEAS